MDQFAHQQDLSMDVVLACAKKLPDPNYWKGGQYCLILLPVEPAIVDVGTDLSPHVLPKMIRFRHCRTRDIRTNDFVYWWMPDPCIRSPLR